MDQPELLREELSLARALAETAAASSPSLAGSLLSVIAKLSTAETLARQKAGQLLSRDQLVKFVGELLQSIDRHFGDLPDYTDRIDGVRRDVEDTLSDQVKAAQTAKNIK
jgi:hypothetical protein